MKKKIQAILTLVILGFGAYYFSKKGEELKQLADISSWQVAAASLIIISNFHIAAVKFKILFKTFKVDLSFKEWWGLPMVRKLGNLLFLKSGTISTAYYLKNNHLLSYPRYVIALTAERVVDIFTFSSLGLLFSLGLFFYKSMEPYIIIFFGAAWLVVTFVLVFSFPIPDRDNRFIQLIRKTLAIWNDFKSNRAVIASFFLLEFLKVIALGARYYIAFNILNQDVALFECFVMSLMSKLSMMINLVPGGIGVQETVVGLSAAYFSHSFDYGVIATALDRLLSTIWFMVLGFICFNVLQLKDYRKEMEILPKPK